MLVFEERGKWESDPENNLSGRVENQQSQPTFAPSLGVEHGPHWWEVSALTTTLALHHGFAA